MSEREDRLNELLHDYLTALDAGNAPDPGDWLRRHPEFADEIRAFLADQRAIGRVADALRPAPVGPDTKPFTGTSPDRPNLIRYFGDYELLEEVARGGMGVVFKARQVSLNRTVALKMILSGQLASPAEVAR